MKISIRKPTKKEIPIILGLLYELGRPRAKQSSDANIYENLIKKYLEDSDKQILVAILEAKIVGIVSIVYIPRLNQKSLEMYIPELLVTKNFQNQGIGKKLVHSCIELAMKKKCHRIRLESGNQRKDSHIFYKNLEFSQSSLSFSKNLE